MSLPRPGYDYCPSCYAEGDDPCRCSKYCSECGGSTNHTTRQHEKAMQPTCVACHDVLVQDEDERCPECLAEYWESRREQYYDNLAKEEGGQG